MNLFLSKSNKNILLLFFLAIPQFLFAQDLEYNDYSWEENIDSIQITEDDKKEPQVILKESRVYEFAYDNSQNLFEYYIVHKVVRVNNDEGIELNNKLYLPYSTTSEVLKHKARVIKPNGEVVEMNDDNVQEATDEENKQKYKYYALEGVEIGSVIEYIYQLKYIPTYTGQRILFQSDVPKKNVSVEIISPINLIFSAKSYNGFPDLKKDTSNTEKNVIKTEIDEIAVQKEEIMSAYTSNLMQMIFKLHKNTYTGKTDIISYGSISSSIYDILYGDVSKGNIKSIKKLIKKIGKLKSTDSKKEKIRIVEDYVKTNFFIIEQAFKGASDIDAIISSGRCSEAGMTRLMVNIYRQLDIRMEIVLACNRYNYLFDEDFEVYNFLDKYLLYFPKINEFIEPSGIFSRLGYVDPSLTSNRALFIREVSLGDYNTGIGKVKNIEPILFDKSTDNLRMDVAFNIEEFNINVNIERELTGHYAQNYQPIYDYIKDDKVKEIDESLVKYIADDAEINNQTVDNKGSAFFGVKPLVTKAEFTSENFIEKVGNKYLFKIGLLIGPQMEMYQENERTLPIMNQFNRLYDRRINFKIPDGYNVTNLEALNILFKDDSENSAFESTHKINGEVLEVSIKEYYKQISYPVEEYESFRKVINAAADFNKVVIYLEKKD